ncbi:hypothetical protein EYF80_037795 [Liparis tanakae]|uniref:Uncharacterized protein n=1 Tax=Liparis tanakae TaxID=230148 RepID=A0A4Z2GF26_9TELE|nr:hypothetical protein EYF80_037795 [Liparis tanakae]
MGRRAVEVRISESREKERAEAVAGPSHRAGQSTKKVLTQCVAPIALMDKPPLLYTLLIFGLWHELYAPDTNPK